MGKGEESIWGVFCFGDVKQLFKLFRWVDIMLDRRSKSVMTVLSGEVWMVNRAKAHLNTPDPPPTSRFLPIMSRGIGKVDPGPSKKAYPNRIQLDRRVCRPSPWSHGLSLLVMFLPPSIEYIMQNIVPFSQEVKGAQGRPRPLLPKAFTHLWKPHWTTVGKGS